MTTYLTIQQTCERLCRSRWTIYRLIEAGKLDVERTADARTYVTQESVEAYAAATQVVLAEPAEASR